MCIVVVKKSGAKMPSKNRIKTMFSSNPDGAGIMVRKHNTNEVIFHKGFMKVGKLLKFIKTLDITKDDEVCMHFRITTSGGTRPAMCHPFVITDNKSGVAELCGVSKQKPLLMHNGIITDLNDRNGAKSDTFLFAYQYLSDKYIMKGLYESNNVFSRLVKMAVKTNKLAILHPKKGIVTIGNFIEDKGVLYSNTSYKYEKFTYGNWDLSSYSTNKVKNYQTARTYTPRPFELRYQLSKTKVKEVYDKAKAIISDTKLSYEEKLIELDMLHSELYYQGLVSSRAKTTQSLYSDIRSAAQYYNVK